MAGLVDQFCSEYCLKGAPVTNTLTTRLNIEYKKPSPTADTSGIFVAIVYSQRPLPFDVNKPREIKVKGRYSIAKIAGSLLLLSFKLSSYSAGSSPTYQLLGTWYCFGMNTISQTQARKDGFRIRTNHKYLGRNWFLCSGTCCTYVYGYYEMKEWKD
jgi:hypothetical protein